MRYYLLMSLILSSGLAWGDNTDYEFETNKIKSIKIESGTCETKSVDLSYCELVNLKTNDVIFSVHGSTCETNRDLTKKIRGNGKRKFKINKITKIKTTATKKMNLVVDVDGKQNLIPFYSNQEDPQTATNSCDFPVTPEDNALLTDRSQEVFKAWNDSKTIYKNQFNQCFVKNTNLIISVTLNLGAHKNKIPNRVNAYDDEFLGNKLVDCEQALVAPVVDNMNDESCMVVKNDEGVRVNCLNSSDSFEIKYADETLECLENTYNEALKKLIFKGYEKFSDRWYVKKAQPISE